jgi:hypothetical protein
MRAIIRGSQSKVRSTARKCTLLGPLLFLAYLKNIWRNNKSSIRLFGNNCVIFGTILNNNDMENLGTDSNRLGE